ncbi:hypothetical protein [Embleya sp. AB8]|uniref:hypothetical protein n=1 Tax=Embleya sp. AB8 TaxID=3156304 RepID=UPI003C735DB4
MSGPGAAREHGIRYGGRHGSLPACVAHSLTHPNPVDRRALTILSLLHGIADLDVLGLFSSGE